MTGRRPHHCLAELGARLRTSDSRVGRIDVGSDVNALGNTGATAWFGLSALPLRGDVARDGWAIDVLKALARPREEVIRIRSVVE